MNRKRILLITIILVSFLLCSFRFAEDKPPFNKKGVFVYKKKKNGNTTLILIDGRFILSDEDGQFNKICVGSFIITDDNAILLVCTPLTDLSIVGWTSSKYIHERKMRADIISNDKIYFQGLTLTRRKCEYLE